MRFVVAGWSLLVATVVAVPGTSWPQACSAAGRRSSCQQAGALGPFAGTTDIAFVTPNTLRALGALMTGAKTGLVPQETADYWYGRIRDLMAKQGMQEDDVRKDYPNPTTHIRSTPGMGYAAADQMLSDIFVHGKGFPVMHQPYTPSEPGMPVNPLPAPEWRLRKDREAEFGALHNYR